MSNYKLNLEHNGDPIAIIKTDKKKNAIVSIGQDSINGLSDVKLKNKDELFQPITRGSRLCTFISGQSGSGKSWYILNYANEYHRMFPKRNIFLFSGLSKDTGSIDKIKGLQRITIDDEFLKTDFSAEDFVEGNGGALIIFDDIDGIPDKIVKNKIWGYLNNFLTTGRHNCIDVCVSMHLSCNKNETKVILNECNNIVIFPMTVGNKINYLLKEYLGLTKNQIKKIMKTDSRWACICKTFPKTVITETECFVLRPDSD